MVHFVGPASTHGPLFAVTEILAQEEQDKDRVHARVPTDDEVRRVEAIEVIYIYIDVSFFSLPPQTQLTQPFFRPDPHMWTSERVWSVWVGICCCSSKVQGVGSDLKQLPFFLSFFQACSCAS